MDQHQSPRGTEWPPPPPTQGQYTTPAVSPPDSSATTLTTSRVKGHPVLVMLGVVVAFRFVTALVDSGGHMPVIPGLVPSAIILGAIAMVALVFVRNLKPATLTVDRSGVTYSRPGSLFAPTQCTFRPRSELVAYQLFKVFRGRTGTALSLALYAPGTRQLPSPKSYNQPGVTAIILRPWGYRSFNIHDIAAAMAKIDLPVQPVPQNAHFQASPKPLLAPTSLHSAAQSYLAATAQLEPTLAGYRAAAVAYSQRVTTTPPPVESLAQAYASFAARLRQTTPPGPAQADILALADQVDQVVADIHTRPAQPDPSWRQTTTTHVAQVNAQISAIKSRLGIPAAQPTPRPA